MRSRGRIGCVWLSLLVVIALVGGAITYSQLYHVDEITPRKPISDAIPPPAGSPLPPINTQEGGNTPALFEQWARPISRETGIPVKALDAYANATVSANASHPGCNLAWTTLAAIGFVETMHGSYNGKVGGSSLKDDGRVEPPIRGLQLDGSPGLAHLPDTDEGKWDGDEEYDRAMGPMQFIPDAWRTYGRDANGDGRADPDNIDDAALAAANLLCDRGGDLSTEKGWIKAVHFYNRSDVYVKKVRNAAANYAVDQVPA